MIRATALIAILSMFGAAAVAGEPSPSIESTVKAIEERVNEALPILLDRNLPDAVAAEFHLSGPDAEEGALMRARKQGLQSATPEFRMEYQTNIEVEGLEPEIIEFGLPNSARSLIYYRGNLYGWRYQAIRQNQFREIGKISWDQINSQQPWLEWQPEEHKFKLRIGGAAAGILGTYSPDEQITLFRGTVPNEAWFLDSIQKMINQRECGANILKSLSQRSRPQTQVHFIAEQELKRKHSSCQEIAEHLISAIAVDLESSRSGHGAYFYSAEKGYAAVFAKGKGSVVKVQFTRKELKKLASANKLYFGTEDASEFAFIGADGVRALVRGYVGSEETPINPAYYSPHFIWQDDSKNN